MNSIHEHIYMQQAIQLAERCAQWLVFAALAAWDKLEIEELEN